MSVFTYFIFYFCYECVRCHVIVIETLYKSDFTHYKIHKVTKCQKDYCLPSRGPLCYSNFVPKMHSFSGIRRQKMSWPWNSGQGSLKVIWTNIDRSATYDFLHEPISHRFWDKQRFPSKISNFSTPVYLTPPLKGFPLELVTKQYVRKLEWWGYQTVKKF